MKISIKTETKESIRLTESQLAELFEERLGLPPDRVKIMMDYYPDKENEITFYWTQERTDEIER